MLGKTARRFARCPLIRIIRASRLTEDIVAKHIVETMAPGLVRVSAYVYALGKFEFSSLRILHVEIDVENEVADLLDGTPRGPIRANPVRNVALTSIAVWIPGPAAICFCSAGGMVAKLKRPEALSASWSKTSSICRRATSMGLVGSSEVLIRTKPKNATLVVSSACADTLVNAAIMTAAR